MAGKESKRIHLTKQRTMTKKRKYSIFLKVEREGGHNEIHGNFDQFVVGGTVKHKEINTNG